MDKEFEAWASKEEIPDGIAIEWAKEAFEEGGRIEREACAKIADTLAYSLVDSTDILRIDREPEILGHNIATQIRARGEHA